MPKLYRTTCNEVIELFYSAGKVYADPFNEVTLDAVFSGPGGQELRVPAYWSGGQEWRVRFSAPMPGTYTFHTECSDPSDPGLHGQQGVVEAIPYTGENIFLKHGAVKVSQDHTHFEHADGTPFFWLADTWWMGLTDRVKFPEEFGIWTDDRVKKGFTVVHMVAGLYPDMPAFDPRGKNEGGYAWEEGFSRINPAFFDHSDLKVQWLVKNGISPLIVAAWGYYLPLLGVEKMKRHWRYLVARWSAYPVMWVLAGELTMPYYLSNDKEGDKKVQRDGWTEVAKYLRKVDPYHRPTTTHTASAFDSSKELNETGLLDFNFVQTGHGNINVAYQAAERIGNAAKFSELQPVVNGEVCYEGILGVAWHDVQRYCFWSTFLSGAIGFSYGANGIWQINQPGIPYGPSPHGMAWGDYPWTEALSFEGSQHLSNSKKLLERYRWWEFKTHPEWVEPHADKGNYNRPFAAGIPGEVTMVYLPDPLAPWTNPMPRICGLEPGGKYAAFLYDPAKAKEYKIGEFEASADGSWMVTTPSAGHVGTDLVLVVEKIS